MTTRILTALRPALPWAHWAACTALNALTALAAGAWTIRLSHDAPGMPLASAMFAVSVFLLLQEADAWLTGQLAAHRKAAQS